MRRSAIVGGDHPELRRLQMLTFDVVPPALNPVPSCAMIEEERMVRGGRISRPFALLSTWGGLCLFHKDPTRALENKLSSVSGHLITYLNDEYETTDHFKLASSDKCFFIAGKQSIWEMDVNGNLIGEYDIMPDLPFNADVTPLSMVCDNQWVACSHKIESGDEVYGAITLIECDDVINVGVHDHRAISDIIVLSNVIQTHRGVVNEDDSYADPIMLSPMCFVAGPPDNRQMYLIKKYKLVDSHDNERFEWRVANFNETPSVEFDVIEEYRGTASWALTGVQNARATSASDQCASMFPSHFRDFQRLNPMSPFFYPSHVMDPTFGGILDNPQRDTDPLIAPVFYDMYSEGQNVHRYATDVALTAYQRAFEIAADSETKYSFDGKPLLKSMAMMHLLEDRMPLRLASWEVCALLTDENHLQIRSMIEMTENDVTHQLTCRSRLSDYKLTTDPVALCGTSQNEQFCLCSAGPSGFLFERFALGANPVAMTSHRRFDPIRRMRQVTPMVISLGKRHRGSSDSASAAAASPLPPPPLAAPAPAALPLSPRSLRAARLRFFGNQGNQGGSRKTIKRSKKHQRPRSRRSYRKH